MHALLQGARCSVAPDFEVQNEVLQHKTLPHILHNKQATLSDLHATIGRFLLSELSFSDKAQTPVAHFVDVGTGSRELPSVTKYLEAELSHSRGLCIEPQVAVHSTLRSNRPKCRAPRVAVGERERRETVFALDGEDSFLPSADWICSNGKVFAHEETLEETQLSTLLAKERGQLCQSGDTYNNLVHVDHPIRREEWVGYLHIDVHAEGLPILLGAVAPLQHGPPLQHQRSAFMLPQFIGLNTSSLPDADMMVNLLQLLEYRQVQLESITNFLLLERTPSSVHVALSLLQRPHFELGSQAKPNGNAGFLYLGFPFTSIAVDPPNGSQHSCMEKGLGTERHRKVLGELTE